MDRPDGSRLAKTTTAASSPDDVPANGRARPPAPVGASVADRASRETGTTLGAGPRGAGGLEAARQPRGWLARALTRSSRRWMARRLLAAGDGERERIEQDLHDGVQAQLTA